MRSLLVFGALAMGAACGEADIAVDDEGPGPTSTTTSVGGGPSTTTSTTSTGGMGGSPLALQPFAHRYDLDAASDAFEAAVAVGDGVFLVGRNDYSDTRVVKLDANGAVVTSSVLTGSGSDELEGATFIPTTQSVLAVGFTTTPGNEQGLVLRYGAEGQLLEQLRVSAADNAKLQGVARSGSLVGVAGYLEQAGTGRDGWIVALDPELAVQWQIALAGPGTDRIYDVAARPGGGFFVSGTSDSSTADLDAFVAAVDAGGEVLWQRVFGGTGVDQAWSIDAAAGAVYAVGTTTSYGPGVDGFVAKLDPDGGLVWGRRIGGDGSDAAYGVAIAKDGGVYVSGRAATMGGSELGMVIRLAPDGTPVWERRFAVGTYAIATFAELAHDRLVWGGYVSDSGTDAFVVSASESGNVEGGCGALSTGDTEVNPLALNPITSNLTVGPVTSTWASFGQAEVTDLGDVVDDCQ